MKAASLTCLPLLLTQPAVSRGCLCGSSRRRTRLSPLWLIWLLPLLLTNLSESFLTWAILKLTFLYYSHFWRSRSRRCLHMCRKHVQQFTWWHSLLRRKNTNNSCKFTVVNTWRWEWKQVFLQLLGEEKIAEWVQFGQNPSPLCTQGLAHVCQCCLSVWGQGCKEGCSRHTLKQCTSGKWFICSCPKCSWRWSQKGVPAFPN